VSDSLKVDTLRTTTTPDSVLPSKNKSILPKKEEKVIKRVSPWIKQSDSFSDVITNDSLLRWQIWPNWGDFYAYRKDVLSYRQGTIGRVDAFSINGYDMHEQNVFFDEVGLNNPITGAINYNFIPHHKIKSVSETYSGNLKSEITSKDYYITKPISYLNYDESSAGYRNLEFMLAQNTSPTTNVELSFWDRREEGYYSRSGVQGSQVFGKIYHHLGDKFQIQGMYLRNQFENEEPFGYVVSDPTFFSFDEFTAQSNESSAKAEHLRTDMKIGIYERADSSSTEAGGLVFTKTRNDYNLSFSLDTLFWDLSEHRAQAFKSINIGSLRLKGEFGAYITSTSDSSTIAKKDWGGSVVSLSSQFTFSKYLSAKLFGGLERRNDKQSSNDISAGILFNASFLDGKIIASKESRMPSIQSMYWGGRNYFGNPVLNNEQVQSIYGDLNITLGEKFEIGISGRYKKTEDAILLSQFKTFVNGGDIELLNGTIFGQYHSQSLEIESSATTEYALNESYIVGVDSLNARGNKLSIRNSIFLKKYAFDKAAFIKMGVRTLFSPFYFESQKYNTELSYWQYNSLEQQTPSFFRLDVEISARVRSMMVLIRWENALDGVGQAGYFESASYPMSPRRLLVGIRAQFRN
tara:strand:- start:5527 stop:7428 length:1902 start_codon:yes stop_codon:yes gene_type:complete